MQFQHINFLFFLIFFGVAISLNGQISVVPLDYSHIIDQANKEQTLERKKSSLDTLPFVEDFAQAGPFPNTDLWEDNHVYVNATLAIDPPSLGVATFDALDNTGSPYEKNGQGDTLTSVGINLDLPNINNLFISYYVQERGFSLNRPESNDSLILEFKTNSGEWLAQKTYTGGNSSFDEFMFDNVQIASPDFHYDGFQFRFRNTSADDPAGAVDVWHLDLVRIINNQIPSQTYKDLAFQYPSQGMLERYSAMPLKHFNVDPKSHLRDTFSFNIYNHFDVARPIGSSGSVMAITELNNGQEVLAPIPYLTSGSALNIEADTGIFITVSPDISTFNINDGSSELEFETMFAIDPIANDNDPGLLDNNFIAQRTIIDDYFAYDDGSAEIAIQAEATGTQIAIEYQTILADTLSAIQIHFPHLLGDVSDQFFNLKVWIGSLDNEPEFVGELLNTVYPDEFADVLQGFTTYRLQNSSTGDLQPVPIKANTKFFIGWEQVSNEQDLALPVGLDLSTMVPSPYQHFKIPNTQKWKSFKEVGQRGILMMRALMGVENAFYTSVEKLDKPSYGIYPNPSTGEVNIEISQGQNLSGHIDVFDIQGRLVHHQTMDQKVQLGFLPAGLYLIHLSDENEIVFYREKLIIQEN